MYLALSRGDGCFRDQLLVIGPQLLLKISGLYFELAGDCDAKVG
jgi:hypothetical protein